MPAGASRRPVRANVLQVGTVEVVALTDAAGSTFDLQRTFPSSDPRRWETFRRHVPEVFATPATWWVRWGCYLVRTRDRLVLVDTGIGPGPSPAFHGLQGQLIDQLRAEGVDTGAVDTVVFTHFHIDHVGWAVDGHARPTFPNARYVTHRLEWEFFQAPETKAVSDYIDRCVTPLESAGVLDLVPGETALTPEITVLHTPGHTPGHMSVLVRSDGQEACILGDVVLHPAQVTEPTWNIVAETDHARAVATRRAMLDRLERDQTILVTGHLPSPGFGRIVRDNGERYWQAVAGGEVHPF